MASKPKSCLSAPDPAEFARRVLTHYRAARRDLPWRRTRDPYAIWVSEIMLQQTRVAAVIPYYERWMQRFPDVRALAGAPLDDVLALWSGLGYYSRARNLHAGARAVVADHGGALPGSAAELRDIPGIGRYTAGAIASIAFGLREPLVDGNVARVLARAYEVEGDVRASAGQRALWQIADALVPTDAPGDFNQGLMELGATVCTPRAPSCLLCPVRDLCRARAAGRQHELPRLPRRKRADELPLIDAVALWIVRRGRLLLGRRPPEGLFGGLWELPCVELPGASEHAGASEASAPAAGLGVRAAAAVPGIVRAISPAPVHVCEQVLTHRRLRIRVFLAELSGALGEPDGERYDALAWHPLAPDSASRSDARGLSAATRAIIDANLEFQGWIKAKYPSACSPKDSKKSSRGSRRSATTSPTRTSATPRSAPREGSKS